MNPRISGQGVHAQHPAEGLPPRRSLVSRDRLHIELLRRISLFRDLPEDDVAAFAAIVHTRHWPAGALILSKDEPGATAFLITEGNVDVQLESSDGRVFIVARLGPGEHFGEMALFDDEPRSASIVATTDTAMLEIRRDDFVSELLSRPQVILRLLSSLTRRLRHTNSQAASLAFEDTAARLAQFLLVNTRSAGGQRSIEITQEELAALVGTTRQTVGRVFREWRGRGLITTSRRRTKILVPEALQAAMHPERDDSGTGDGGNSNAARR